MGKRFQAFEVVQILGQGPGRSFVGGRLEPKVIGPLIFGQIVGDSRDRLRMNLAWLIAAVCMLTGVLLLDFSMVMVNRLGRGLTGPKILEGPACLWLYLERLKDHHANLVEETPTGRA